MTKQEILSQIEFWEQEADGAEEELRNAESLCRYYYDLLDELEEVE